VKYALINPAWDFTGSTYFGCQETHLPLELFYAQQQLRQRGHEALVIDAHLQRLTAEAAAARAAEFGAEVVVVTTAPTYLFWRCPQPELRVAHAAFQALRTELPHATLVAIGPHGSATAETTRAKTGCDVVVRGEPDQMLHHIAEGAGVNGTLQQTDMAALGAIDFQEYPLELRHHRHHVFSGEGRGAEVEATRGCPWSCSFCNKTLFRNRFRERPVATVLEEVAGLARRGIDYIYFIDEIFGCARSTPELLKGLRPLPVRFGIQTRIDLWKEDTLAALGAAGCVSLECGIESVSSDGRARWRKGCRLENDRIINLLVAARQAIPWVQANLIAGADDDASAIAAWRTTLIDRGIWASRPVPVYAFPGSPLYQSLYGAPDGQAWERAHADYLKANAEGGYSDIQAAAPLRLEDLEALDASISSSASCATGSSTSHPA
jgi:B12-binding domain/radical SAM domain protein of rhizo-twelve system